MLEDQAQALNELSEIILSEKPDLVLLSGDLFDRSVPPEDAVKLLDLFLAKTVLEHNVPIAMIPGNHDSCTRVGVGADRDGRVGIDYGVYGVPESFLIDAKGVIRYKQIGPFTPEAIQTKLIPLVQQLKKEAGNG